MKLLILMGHLSMHRASVHAPDVYFKNYLLNPAPQYNIYSVYQLTAHADHAADCLDSFTLQAVPSRTEPKRYGLENKPTL